MSVEITLKLHTIKVLINGSKHMKDFYDKDYKQSIIHGELEIKSVSDLADIALWHRQTPTKSVLYRGQADFQYDLQPSSFRLVKHFQSEGNMVRDLIASHPREFENSHNMLDKLVHMQHYGLPTRLLDVTKNLLVALYFASSKEFVTEVDDKVDELTGKKKQVKRKKEVDGAVFVLESDKRKTYKYFDSDVVSILANLSNCSGSEKKAIKEMLHSVSSFDKNSFNESDSVKHLVRFIKAEKPYLDNVIEPEDVFRVLVVEPKKSNPRVVAQAGAFLLSRIPAYNRMPYLDDFKATRYRVPAGSKLIIREQLAQMGVDIATLFPEIEYSAKNIS
jgi:FRG domain